MARRNTRNAKNSIKNSIYNDIIGIIFVSLGLLIIFSLFFTAKAGILGYIISKVLFFLIGIGTYIFPFILISIGFCYIAKKGNFVFNSRFYGIFLAVVVTELTIMMVNLGNYYNGQLPQAITSIYNATKALHGGVISMLIDIPLNKLFGNGAYVIFACIYVVAFVLIYQKSVFDVIRSIIGKNKGKIKFKQKPKDTTLRNIAVEEYKEKDNSHKIKIIDFMKTASLFKEEEKMEDEHEEINIKDSNEATFASEEFEKEIENNCIKNVDMEYNLPKLDLLNDNEQSKMKNGDKKELLTSATKLTDTLSSFGVEAKVLQVTRGPSVTRYELQPNSGVKVSKIVNLSDDIALNLASSGVRIEAPIPGKAAIGIEVPNKELTPVYLKEVLESEAFFNSKSRVAAGLGKDIGGNCVIADLAKMPHVLIAGATGSGKSVCINTLIISILYKYSPEDVRLLMIDPKVVELSVYNGIPHLLIPVVTDPKKAAGALNWAVNEMTKRYKMFADNNVRNIEGYNELYEKGKIDNKLPWIVMIIDELADLMMVCPNDIEDYIGRLAQMARAAGMHLVIATQRPSVDVITGVIKANIPSRISFAVSSQIDSRTILDMSGAEKLLGKGDMLFYPLGEAKPIRIQGAFISEEEVERVVSFIKNQSEEAKYEEQIIEEINNNVTKADNSDDEDELFDEAVKFVVEYGQASTSFIQRKLKIGYNRAARIMEQLEQKNIISKRDGSKPRNILIGKDDN